ncbi:hypothetical protein SGRA_2582 [Saprospira grandis str. Lewin]|uniref:Uncharacterized protein n=1 Tax=Saprospira grandis (strain Lewin) TaxID=984262 RepID=H6L6R4_SAPGL|nr:hypothetical protein SGRA_2582 [Saprospira grandis str. Lewin]
MTQYFSKGFFSPMFWGLLPSAGATLQGSQVCSALQPPLAALVCGFAAPFRIARPLNCCAALGFPLRPLNVALSIV